MKYFVAMLDTKEQIDFLQYGDAKEKTHLDQRRFLPHTHTSTPIRYTSILFFPSLNVKKQKRHKF